MSSKEFNISITLILHWRVLRWGYHDDINYGYMSLFQLSVYMCNGQEYTFSQVIFTGHSHACVYMDLSICIMSFMVMVCEHVMNSVVCVCVHGQEYTFCVHSRLCVYMINFLIHGYSMGTIHEFSCVCFCAWPKVHILRALSFMCVHNCEPTYNYYIKSSLHDAKHTFSVLLNLQGAKVELYLAPLASCLNEGHKFKIGQ